MKSYFLVAMMTLMSLIFLPGCENEYKEHAIHAIAINPSYSQTINDITLEIKCLSKAEKKSFFKDNQRLLNAVLDGSIVPLQVSIANGSNACCTVKPKNISLSLLSQKILFDTIKSTTNLEKTMIICSILGVTIGLSLSVLSFGKGLAVGLCGEHLAIQLCAEGIAFPIAGLVYGIIGTCVVGIGLAVRSGLANRALKKALSKHVLCDTSVHVDAMSSHKGIIFVKKADYRDSFKMTFDSKNGKQKIAFDVALS